MNETQMDRWPSASAARQIRDYETPVSHPEARPFASAFRTHAGPAWAHAESLEDFSGEGLV
jgi:hypothetical protein